MFGMFKYAESFNQPLSDWQVNSVADKAIISYMFWGASAFDQDLGWCVDDDGNPYFMAFAFSGTPCESTSCGVRQGDACAPTLAPTPAPTPGALGSDGATARSVALCLAVAALLVLV